MPHWQHTRRRAEPGVSLLPTSPNTTAPLSHAAEDAREKVSRKAAELGECGRGPPVGMWGPWRVAGLLGAPPWADRLLLMPQIRQRSRTATSTHWALSHARRPLSAPPTSRRPRC